MDDRREPGNARHEPGTGPLGAILVGGRSRRMGRSKAVLDLGGRTLARHALATMSGAVADVVQVGDPPMAELGLPSWKDARPDAGPAGGLEAALAGAAGRPVAVIAVDTPFLPAALLTEALRRIAAGATASAPRFEGRWHPLCGAYSSRALGPLRERLDAGELDLQGLLSCIDTRAIEGPELERFGDPRHWLRNINTPEELESARRELARRNA